MCFHRHSQSWWRLLTLSVLQHPDYLWVQDWDSLVMHRLPSDHPSLSVCIIEGDSLPTGRGLILGPVGSTRFANVESLLSALTSAYELRSDVDWIEGNSEHDWESMPCDWSYSHGDLKACLGVSCNGLDLREQEVVVWTDTAVGHVFWRGWAGRCRSHWRGHAWCYRLHDMYTVSRIVLQRVPRPQSWAQRTSHIIH